MFIDWLNSNIFIGEQIKINYNLFIFICYRPIDISFIMMKNNSKYVYSIHTKQLWYNIGHDKDWLHKLWEHFRLNILLDIDQ